MAGTLLLFGIVSHYMASSLETSGTDMKGIHPALRPLITVVAVAAMLLWVAASIAGVDMALSGVVMQFIAVTFALMLLLTLGAFGRDSMRKKANEVAMMKSLMESYKRDWLKGLFVFCCLPLVLVFFALSAANQAVRKYLGLPCCLPAAHDAEGGGPLVRALTSRGRGFAEFLFARPTNVFVWTLLWGILYFVMNVGVGKVVVLMLAWLNEETASWGPGAVTGVTVAFGIFLFLMPPVPGVPVYLFAGVVMVNSLQDEVGFWPGIFITSGVCLFIKLTACAIQQKVFGENLGSYVVVRKAVGFNSMMMRAIRYCLEQPGLSPGKVSILCGGPDWPVSVGCGILKLPLLPMLIGTLPVYPLFMLQTVMAGAFQLKVAESSTWDSMATCMLTVCSGGMLLTSFAMCYYVAEVQSTKQEELVKYPVDEEVAELERLEEEGKLAWGIVTEWKVLPGWVQANLSSAACLMVTSCYFFAMFGSSCFEEFEVTDSISEDLRGGHWYNIVKSPNGWVALGLFGGATAQLVAYYVWAGRATRAHLAGSRAAGGGAEEA